MQQNWSDFYWLTGETPITLHVLCEMLKNHFVHHRNLGRRRRINFRNQVYAQLVPLEIFTAMKDIRK